MFDYVRNNTRLMGFIMALFIIPAFVLVGVDGYSRINSGGETVAVVAGQDIKKEQWDAAHRQSVDRLRASRPNLDVKQFDSDEARFTTLERLVRERVLAAAAQKMNLFTSDQKLARDLQQNESIASLRGPDGKLDMARYRQLLGTQGMTPEMFEAQMRLDLSQQQVTQGIAASGFSTPAAAKASLNAFFERREVQFVRFDTAAFKSKVQVTDADVEQFYNANPSQYQAPEQADVEFLVLDQPTVMQNIVLADADVKAYFEQNAARYSSKEERRARHILINAAAKAPAAEREAAKAKANALLTQLRSAPGTFADVAKKNSQDAGSAPNGGDLDFFQRGTMVKPFEDAAFALNKGDISDVVESEFGYHIIQLTDVKPSVQRPFAQVKPEIEAELKKSQAQREFAEKAETFGNLVYEQADALQPVADKFKLKLQTATGIGRVPSPGMPPVLANEKLLAAIFSAESLDKKRNTESIETGANQLVAARVTAYRPAQTRPLVEVKASIRERLLNEKAQALAREDGEKNLAAWKAGADAKLSVAMVVSRDKPLELAQKEVLAALRADTTALPAWVGVDLGAKGYAVLKVNKTVERTAPAADVAAQEVGQYNQWWSTAEGTAYYNLLKKRFKAEIKVLKPAAVSVIAG